MSIFGGPYKLTFKVNGKVTKVKSLCILDDFKVTERTYENGKMNDNKSEQMNNLNDAITKMISRLEVLMQKEFFYPVEAIDLTSL